jgi:hypothetical protein
MPTERMNVRFLPEDHTVPGRDPALHERSQMPGALAPDVGPALSAGREQNRLPEKATTAEGQAPSDVRPALTGVEKRQEVELPPGSQGRTSAGPDLRPAYRENADGLPEKIFLLRQKLYRQSVGHRRSRAQAARKAKQEPKFRFYTMYGLIFRRDVLSGSRAPGRAQPRLARRGWAHHPGGS